MKGWIKVQTLRTGKDIFINTRHIVSVSPALGHGNAYTVIETVRGEILVDESPSYIMDVIEEAEDH